MLNFQGNVLSLCHPLLVSWTCPILAYQVPITIFVAYEKPVESPCQWYTCTFRDSTTSHLPKKKQPIQSDWSWLVHQGCYYWLYESQPENASWGKGKNIYQPPIFRFRGSFRRISSEHLCSLPKKNKRKTKCDDPKWSNIGKKSIEPFLAIHWY